MGKKKKLYSLKAKDIFFLELIFFVLTNFDLFVKSKKREKMLKSYFHSENILLKNFGQF